MIGTMKEEDVDCVLKHPHKGKHLQSKTVIRRMKDPRWKNRCVLCGKKTDLRKEVRDWTGSDIYVCSPCFFDRKFCIKKEVKIAEQDAC